MQEMQDKTLAEIAKAFKGSFIYAPGGTVNIGCNIFEAGQAPKKKADPKKAEAEASRKTARRRKSVTKVDEEVEAPKGDSAPPLPVGNVDDDDDQGDGSTPDPVTPVSDSASPDPDPADAASPPFRRNRSRRRDTGSNGA